MHRSVRAVLVAKPQTFVPSSSEFILSHSGAAAQYIFELLCGGLDSGSYSLGSHSSGALKRQRHGACCWALHSRPSIPGTTPSLPFLSARLAHPLCLQQVPKLSSPSFAVSSHCQETPLSGLFVSERIHPFPLLCPTFITAPALPANASSAALLIPIDRFLYEGVLPASLETAALVELCLLADEYLVPELGQQAEGVLVDRLEVLDTEGANPLDMLQVGGGRARSLLCAWGTRVRTAAHVSPCRRTRIPRG